MNEIHEKIKAGYPALWIRAFEEYRVIQEINRIAQVEKLSMKVWSVTQGWQDVTSEGEYFGKDEDAADDPMSALETVGEEENKGTVFVFQNFHFYMNEEQPAILQAFKELIPICKQQAKFMVFVSAQVELPVEVEKELTVIDFQLPALEELEESLEVVLASVNREVEISDRKKLLESALGMTLAEAENAFALAYVRHNAFNDAAIKTVQKEKAETVKKTGILEYIETNLTLSDVGGLDEFKKWLKDRERAFTEEARRFGIREPKGVLLAGPPGTGKSLSAKAVSAAWELPLLRFDVSRVFGSLVGESEQKMRQALQMAEAIAPCVLWVDEIEKAMAGVGSSGSTDSGVTARVYGQFLTWMQEKESPVFVFATANEPYRLDAAMLRKGRFDELFWVDLPAKEERKMIFEIHLQKRNRNPENFDCDTLAEESKNFGGAEIEESVEAGLNIAFGRGKEDVETDDILQAIRETKPVSDTMKEDIERLRKWGNERARNASQKQTVKIDSRQFRHMNI